MGLQNVIHFKQKFAPGDYIYFVQPQLKISPAEILATDNYIKVALNRYGSYLIINASTKMVKTPQNNVEKRVLISRIGIVWQLANVREENANVSKKINSPLAKSSLKNNQAASSTKLLGAVQKGKP